LSWGEWVVNRDKFVVLVFAHEWESGWQFFRFV
jgi:hypothetical protein